MLELHDPITFEPGQVPFATRDDPTGFATIDRFVRDNALTPVADEEDWPDGRVLHAHLVMLDGARLIGSGMIVRDEGDDHCKLLSFALAPEYRDPHLIWLFEDALAEHDWIDGTFSYVQVTGGRRIPVEEFSGPAHVC